MKKFFERIFSGFSKVEPKTTQQAVLIHLDGLGLSSEIYEKYDLSTLEDQLSEVLEPEGIGEVDGNEIGPEETIIFLYGADAEKIFTEIQPVLRSYPLCQNAKVEIRHGAPGAHYREVTI